MSRSDEELVRRITAARETTGISQETLAGRMRARGYPDFRQQTIAKIETGDRSVKWGEALALADSVGLTPQSLLGVEADLVTSYARLDVLRSAFQETAWNYLEELITTAHVADSAESLRVADDLWLTSSMPWQTPLMLLRTDVQIALESTMKRRGIPDSGRYIQLLAAAVRRDAVALGESGTESDRAQRHDG